jgi:hypothetical protein
MLDQKLISHLWVSSGLPELQYPRLTIMSTDQDTFLPSAIQRYHQLFMPVLQLVHGMLASLGTKHSTAAHQVAIS